MKLLAVTGIAVALLLVPSFQRFLMFGHLNGFSVVHVGNTGFGFLTN